MPCYTHLSPAERDQIACLRSDGLSLRAISRRLGRAASTLSRELRRNSHESGAYRPPYADGGYMLRRQRPAVLEQEAALSAYVVDRLTEGWTPEQIAGRLRLGIEKGLRSLCAETIYRWIYRRGQKAQKFWRYLVRRRARRKPMRARVSQDKIADKIHISQRTDAANSREEAGHWEADLVICKHNRPLLVLHERKTRLTLMTRMVGKTAGETIALLMALVRRLDPRLRGSVTFDNDTTFARHALLRGMLAATTYFCDAYASWQKGGVENANGRIRRWIPRRTDLGEISDAELQEIAMTINLTPRKCLGWRSPVEAILQEMGRSIQIKFA